MKSLLFIATVGIVALAGAGFAQDSKKKAEPEITKAVYMVQNLH